MGEPGLQQPEEEGGNSICRVDTGQVRFILIHLVSLSQENFLSLYILICKVGILIALVIWGPRIK